MEAGSVEVTGVEGRRDRFRDRPHLAGTGVALATTGCADLHEQIDLSGRTQGL
jgi:hypothetical protein